MALSFLELLQGIEHSLSLLQLVELDIKLLAT